MKVKYHLMVVISTLLIFTLSALYFLTFEETIFSSEDGSISLLKPKIIGDMAVEGSIAKRRSIRDYSGESLTIEEVSHLLWAAQGITNPTFGLRSFPSAGGTHHLQLFLIVGKDSVRGILEGVYVYRPENHSTTEYIVDDVRSELQIAALDQQWVGEASIVIVIAADYKCTTDWYGARGFQHVHIEVGCVTQNIYLHATALDLGTVLVGAFHEKEVQTILNLSEDITLLGIMPVGHHHSIPE